MKPSNSTFSFAATAPAKAITEVHPRHIVLVLSAACIITMLYVGRTSETATEQVTVSIQQASPEEQKPFSLNGTAGTAGAQSSSSVATIVADALTFKGLCTTSEQTTLQLTYTTTLARKWSNLPCGTGCRNGVQLGAMTGTKYEAGMQVIRDALSALTENGYPEYYQTNLAEAYLHANGGGSGYDSTLRWIAFLGTPSATGAWMLQFGGHHYAANIAFNNGHVIGATPFFMGVEPKSFSYGGTTYAPLNSEHDAFTTMLASLTSAQLTSAKLTQSFMDCYMIPGESNNHSYSGFPAKAGLLASSLTQTQKDLILAVIENYTGDMDSATHATQQAIYAGEIDNTYIGWVGSGTSGNASSFLNAQGNYGRIDGPHVWIEFSCQGGIVIPGQIHYHTVWRDHVHDYGQDLSGPAIDTTTLTPLKLLSFTANVENKIPVLRWITTNEVNVSHFEIEQSSNPSKNFRAIGRVNAKNVTIENRYSFNVTAQLPAVTYFRLKMVDLDGKITYSGVVILHSGSINGLSVVNTFVTNELMIKYPSGYSSSQYRILSLQGQVVASGNLQQGSISTSINVSSLLAGQYVITIESNGNKLLTRFIKS